MEKSHEDPFGWMGKGEVTPEQGIEINEQMAKSAAEAEMDFARLVFDVMESASRGPELMAKLEDLTIHMPLMQVNGVIMQGGEVALSPSDWAYYRDGQNSLIRMLKYQIAFAKNPPEVLEQKDEDDG